MLGCHLLPLHAVGSRRRPRNILARWRAACHAPRAIRSRYLGIIEHTAIVMLRCGDVLGFTPAARPRIALVPGPGSPPVIDGEAELDPWEALGRLHGRNVPPEPSD